MRTNSIPSKQGLLAILGQWILAFRPKTLTAAVVPIFVGSAVAEISQIWIAALALAASLFIQIATNLVNDSKDFIKGADQSDRIGPRRVTQSGTFSPQAVMAGAYFFFALAVLVGLPLVYHGGLPILAIGIVSLIAGYCYTGGPFPLAYRGLGDLFVFIFFGVIAVVGMHFLNMGNFSLNALTAGVQVGFLCTVLIAINNLRDVVTDARVNKKTLAVRFGKNFVRWEITGLLLGTYLIQSHWWYYGFKWAAVLPFLTLPVAVRIIWSVWSHEPSEKWNQFLALAALNHLAFGLLLSLGLLWV